MMEVISFGFFKRIFTKTEEREAFVDARNETLPVDDGVGALISKTP